jgi:hypothetical protein
MLVALVSLVHGAAAAQTDGLTIDGVNDDDYPIVEVTITVSKALEDISLPKEAFAVTENGGPPQRPLLGNRPEEPEAAPPRAVLAIDVSGSMDGAPIERARDAADVRPRAGAVQDPGDRGRFRCGDGALRRCP